VTATENIRRRIETRISQGAFLASLLGMAKGDSTDVQEKFVIQLSRIAAQVRGIFENNDLIRRLPYDPKIFWPKQRGRAIAFIDAGVASIDLPSTAPVGIRVGSYVVRPGDESKERESFNIELSLVDDLYSTRGHLFDDDFHDLAKLRDTARMTSETAAAYRLAKVQGSADIIMLHGPLVNPVAPYGLDEFPAFGLDACRTFHDEPQWDGDDTDRQFVPIYLGLLERLRNSGKPVFGVVERSVGRDPVVTRRLLAHLCEKKWLKESDRDNILNGIQAYGLNDTALLDVVLGEGEYTSPIPVNRQGPVNKWPEQWKELIRKYPASLTTYLKPSEAVLPFRIETFEDTPNLDDAIDLILHTSRLLPSYGFPVGLDIVDKFAKVPSWMSRGVKGQHQAVLIRKALESGDPRAITFAKRVLAAKGRDWLFRPEA
jgi:hypothetical protein